MRILVVGTGAIGRRHIDNFRRLEPKTDFHFVRLNGRRDAFSDGLAATVHATLEAGVAATPNLAIVANPSAMHAATVLPLLRAGIACYIEKPAVTTFDDLSAVRKAIPGLRHAPPTLVGCNLRFLPSLLEMRRRIAEGSIGLPVRAQLEVGQWLPDWRPAQDYRKSYSADIAMGGGVVLDLVHEIDMARFVFGEFDQVAAAGGRYSRLEIGTEDAAAILLSRAKGPVVTIGLDYVARKPVRRYEVVGDEATIEWDLFERRLRLRSPSGDTELELGEGAFDVAGTYLAAARDILDAVRQGTPTRQDLADGLRSAELAIRANAAMRQ